MSKKLTDADLNTAIEVKSTIHMNGDVYTIIDKTIDGEFIGIDTNGNTRVSNDWFDDGEMTVWVSARQNKPPHYKTVLADCTIDGERQFTTLYYNGYDWNRTAVYGYLLDDDIDIRIQVFKWLLPPGIEATRTSDYVMRDIAFDGGFWKREMKTVNGDWLWKRNTQCNLESRMHMLPAHSNFSGEWVDASKRLPNRNREVLVSANMYGVARLTDQGWVTKAGRLDTSKITMWFDAPAVDM